ncbi:hypothetical protein [Methanocella sp. MCL-LM]|uniref:hypothetical protein n=1 Tax=Methanocella sp. MCL-LM TaxID=3412035 RepID=UPI003C76AF72
MRPNDRVILLRELKKSIDGSVIPEGAEGVILAKIPGSGWNTFEVDFGEHGTAICDKQDLAMKRE